MCTPGRIIRAFMWCIGAVLWAWVLGYDPRLAFSGLGIGSLFIGV